MRTRIYGLAMAVFAFVAVGGCSEQTDKDSVLGICTNGVSQRVLDYIVMGPHKGKSKGVNFCDILSDIATVTNRIERQRLYKLIEERIFSVDMASRSFIHQTYLVSGTWEVSNELAQYMVDMPQEERWRIRLRALEWVRQQIPRIEKSEPSKIEDLKNRKMVPVKTGNKVEYYPQVLMRSSSDHSDWSWLLRSTRKRLAHEYPRYLVQRLERDIDDDDLRAELQKKMEEILGRSLTVDDFQPKDLIESYRLKREERKKGAQKAGGAVQ